MNVALTIVNVALNLYLIPAYGPWGAGLATLLSMLVYAVAQVVYLARHAPGTASPLALNVVPLVAAIGAGILTWLTKGQLFVMRALLPAGAYVAILLLTGFFDAAELNAMRQLGRRGVALLSLRRAVSS
jgi:O-antigen/teichoic acid export membrane protein